MTVYFPTLPAQAFAPGRARTSITTGMWLVIIAAIFNPLLCFINTRHWFSIGSGGIASVELGIMALGLLQIRNRLPKTAIEISLLLIGYLIALHCINPGSDLKILHDLGIMYIFYKLGTCASVEIANRLLWIIMLIVLAMGMFEWLLPDLFGNVFDVWSYYVNKGVIDQDQVKLSQSNLFISGNRGGDAVRNFFPQIFGSHRVSSIFLEPDSLGNFSVVAFAWCLSTASGSRSNRILMFFCACLCFVLPDSRFASNCCAIMLVFKFFIPSRSKLLAFMLPLLVVTGLLVAAMLKPMPGGILPCIIDDDFTGRLMFSGRLLSYWHPAQWLGFAPSQVYTADTGFAYLINNLGLPVTLLLWAIFAAAAQEKTEAITMKLMVSIYFATSLCVGASVFTIKTGALLWFLYGAVNAGSGKTMLGRPAEEINALRNFFAARRHLQNVGG